MRVIKYPGGKAGMADQIIPLIPRTHAYVEPFGGAGSILLTREPSPVEVYNDLDGALATMFRVLRDPAMFERFTLRVNRTLYARASQNEAVDILGAYRLWAAGQPCEACAVHLCIEHEHPGMVEVAWALYVQQNQSVVASVKRTYGQWARSMTVNDGVAAVISGYDALVGNLDQIHARLSRVQIDCRDALEAIAYWDSPDTAFYVDPPYVLDTRVERAMYSVELEVHQHTLLIAHLLDVAGSVTVSGYDHPAYAPLDAAGWLRYEFTRSTPMTASQRPGDGHWDRAPRERGTRTEIVWVNPHGQRLLDEATHRLFDHNTLEPFEHN